MAFTIAILAISFIQESLSLIAQRLYVMKKQERNMEIVSQIQDVMIAQRFSFATLLDRRSVENKNCDLMSYEDFNYYACLQEVGIEHVYLSNGYSFLILTK